MVKTPQQLQEESDRLARKTMLAREREERKLKKAFAGRRPKNAGARKTPERLSQARQISVSFAQVENVQTPANNWTNYVNNRQSAHDAGEEHYCNFGTGAKSITRHASTGTKRKKAGGGVTVIAHSDKHNDRYGTDEALHVDKDREQYNVYWNIYDGYYRPKPGGGYTKKTKDREQDSWLEKFGVTKDVEQPMRFWESELKFIRETFGEAIEAQNEKHKQRRQYDRMTDLDSPKSVKEWQNSRKDWRLPTEMILQIGDRDDSVRPEILMEIVPEFLRKIQERDNFITINWALHCDENGAPHVHVRGYYVAVDENGHKIPGKTLALQQRGVKPEIGRKIKEDLEAKGLDVEDYGYGRGKNEGVTFSREASEMLFELAEQHGVRVMREPQQRAGLRQEDWRLQRKTAPARVAASLQRLEERRGDVREVLTILDAVHQGLQRYPTQWVDPAIAAAAAQETHTRLKAASGVLDDLPTLLEKVGIETPTVEMVKLREGIARTHRAAGRARSNAGKKSREQDDEKNQMRLQERFFWLEQLHRLHAALQRAGDARPDIDEALADAERRAADEKARADALEAELNAMRQQQSQEEHKEMAGSMNERLRQIEAGIALSTVDDARRALQRGLVKWDNGIVDRELLQRASTAECVRDGAANAELAQTTHLEIIALPGSWIRTGVDVVDAARNATAPAPAPAPAQESMRTEDWFASQNSSQRQQRPQQQGQATRRTLGI